MAVLDGVLCSLVSNLLYLGIRVARGHKLNSIPN